MDSSDFTFMRIEGNPTLGLIDLQEPRLHMEYKPIGSPMPEVPIAVRETFRIGMAARETLIRLQNALEGEGVPNPALYPYFSAENNGVLKLVGFTADRKTSKTLERLTGVEVSDDGKSEMLRYDSVAVRLLNEAFAKQAGRARS